MMKYPKVSFLILNWNGLSFTKKCISSLLKTPYPHFEIVLVDNGSQNNEAEKIKKLFGERVTLIKSPTNMGYAGGMNLAFKHATGELVMVLNNDMEFHGDWLMPLVKKLLSNEKIVLCQPKVKDLKNKEYFEYAAAAGGFIDVFGYPFARGRIFSHVEKDQGQYDTEITVAWAGVFLAKKKVLQRIGFFDPMYFTYAEDVDLCWRVYGYGYHIVYVPSSVVYHYGGGVIGKNLPRKMFFIHRNHLIVLLKYWKLSTIFLLLPLRILMDVVSFFYYIATGYSSFAWSIVKAYISLLAMWPTIYDARKKIQKKMPKKYIHLMPIYKKSIVWDYFIGNKKVFSDISYKSPAVEISIT